jgi:hypothetical protein
MVHEKAHQPEYREATPEEIAEINRQADEAERYHFGFSSDEKPHIAAINPSRQLEPGPEDEVSPSVVVIVDMPKCAGQ